MGFQVLCMSAFLCLFAAQGVQCTQQETSKHDEAKDAQGLGLLFNGDANLDTTNPQLLRFLESCPYEVCRIYKEFLAFEASPKGQSDIEKFVLPFEGLKSPSADEMTRSFLESMTSVSVIQDMPPSLASEVGIPAWLALKYPQIFDGPWDRCSMTHFQADTVLEKFDTLMNDMEHGRWVTTSYCPWQGSIRHDLGIYQRVAYYEMHLAPARVLEKAPPFEESLEPLRMWSFKGLWNTRTYKSFQEAFDQAVKDLQGYYKSLDSLGQYAPQAQKIVAWYVGVRFSHKCFTGDERFAYEIVTTCKGDIPTLKEKTHNLTQKGWDALLHMALLRDFPVETIAWIIEKGARVNSPFYDETCLMKAVGRVDVLRLLLERGGDVNAATLYGKTALFYAVQFGSLEAVRVLLEAGAGVNAAILDLGSLAALYERQLMQSESEYDALPEMVADFTPLVYAKRYGTPAMEELLMTYGASLGKAPRERIQEWVRAGRTAQRPIAKAL